MSQFYQLLLLRHIFRVDESAVPIYAAKLTSADIIPLPTSRLSDFFKHNAPAIITKVALTRNNLRKEAPSDLHDRASRAGVVPYCPL